MINKPNESIASIVTPCLKDRPLIKGLTGQTFAQLRGIIRPPVDSFDHGNNSSTIMLVPGFLCHPSSLISLGELLKERYNVIFAPAFRYLNTGDISKSAFFVFQKGELVLHKHEKNGDLKMLTHSMGGLIAAKSLQYGDTLRINRLIACATPWLGAPIARLAPRSVAASQMNQQGGHISQLDLSDISNKIHGRDNYISSGDTFIPPQYQDIQEQYGDVIGDKLTQHYKDGWTHTDFITGDKMPTFANQI